MYEHHDGVWAATLGQNEIADQLERPGMKHDLFDAGFLGL